MMSSTPTRQELSDAVAGEMYEHGDCIPPDCAIDAETVLDALDRLGYRIVGPEDAQQLGWLLLRLTETARPSGAGEEMNEAERTEQAYASMLLARFGRTFALDGEVQP